MTLKGDDAVTIRGVILSVDSERPVRPELAEGAQFYATGDDDTAS